MGNKKTSISPSHHPISWSRKLPIARSSPLNHNIRHQPASITPYLWKGVISLYAGSINPTSLWYSIQQPKCMMLNKIKKLQWFQSKPASITITNTTAVNALVLKVCQLNAMQ